MANFYRDNEDLKFFINHPLMPLVVRLRERDYTEREKYDYAPIDYEDAIDSYDNIMEILGEISGNIIAANAEAVDNEGPKLINNRVIYAKGTQENLDELGKAGFYAYTLPRMYGGLNMPILTYVMAAEIISRADAGFVNIYGLQDCAETIREFASEDIKNKYLPMFAQGKTAAMVLTEPDAGSDLQSVTLSAKYDENAGCWKLNGVKRFITNGDADISLVLARSEEGTTDGRGLSLFLYERDNTITVRRIEHKLGIIGSPTCELVFKDSPAILIGERKLGLIKYVMSLMNAARLGVGAQSVGIAEAAYREALKYANEREQFGKKINNFPPVYEMLTNMRVDIQAVRTLLYETAIYVDLYKTYEAIEKERPLTQEERMLTKKYQKYSDLFTPLVKLFGSEYCNRIAYDAIQVHGGTGFMKDFPIQRIYRDARITSIYEGTSQLQVIAAIRGVTNGTFLSIIKNDYETMTLSPELDYYRNILMELTEEWDLTVKKVVETKNTELLDFMARRLVEMVGNIIMSYLLLRDSNIDSKYTKIAELFIMKIRAENRQKMDYINNFDIKDLASFKLYI